MATHHSSYEPIGRFGHAAVAVGTKVHMWRGAGPNRNVQEFASTVEVFDMTTELWEQKSIHGIPPLGWSNTAYTVVGTSLYSFGGSDGKACSNSLYQLDLQTLEWKELLVRNPASGPHRKYGSRMVSYGDNQLLIFAGKGDSGCTNEVHIFNLDKGEPELCLSLEIIQVGSNAICCKGPRTAIKLMLQKTIPVNVNNVYHKFCAMDLVMHWFPKTCRHGLIFYTSLLVVQ